MAVTIREVNSRKELREFISFPEIIYKGCENWVNPLYLDEYSTLSKKKNPAFEFCEASYFLAYKENKVVGRVAAIINHNANKSWNEQNIRFGWLDFIDDFEVSAALMEKVEEIAFSRGLKAVNGPFGFTDMDREGLLVDGFDKMGSLTTLYNYPYYGEHLEKLGYCKDIDWEQREFDVPDEVPEKLRRYSEIVRDRYNVRILRPSSKRELKRYGRGLFEALNEAFMPLYGFSPLTDAQIDSYVKQYIPLINFDLICILLDREDKVVGFAVTMPSLSTALKKSRGKILPFGFLYLLKALKRYELIDMLMIGIIPSYHNKGLNAVIFDHLNTNFIKLGTRRVIANPQLENNTAVQNIFDYYPARPYMTRRCYLKSIEVKA